MNHPNNDLPSFRATLENFWITIGWNTLALMVPILILIVIFAFNHPPDQNFVKGILVIFIGNMLAYVFISSLYLWKSLTIGTGINSIKEYFTNKRLSLRPWSGYTEITTLTFFFLVLPAIIVGYLILRSIEGYRGEQTSEENAKAEIKGELNSIKAIGLVLNLFTSLLAASYFHNSQLFDHLTHNISWLVNFK